MASSARSSDPLWITASTNPNMVWIMASLLLAVALTLIVRRINRMTNWSPHPELLAQLESKLKEFQPERRHAKTIHQFEFIAEDNTAHKMYYELYGGDDSSPDHETKKVLFIAGLATCSDWWLPQIRFFSQQDRYQICVFDNRGAGWRSTTPTRGHMISTQQMAKDALRLMDHLGWRRAHICAISMGGMIAQQLALLAPERIESLILNSTYLRWVPRIQTLRFFTEMWIFGFLGSMRRKQVFHLLDHMLSNRFLFEEIASLSASSDPTAMVTNSDNETHTTTTTTTTATTTTTMTTTKSTESARAVMTRREALFESEYHVFYARHNPKGSGMQTIGSMLHRVSETELAEALKNVPVFVISGTDDKVIHHNNSLRIYAALCRASSQAMRKLRLFEGAGHKVNGDFCQDEYNQELISWLDQVSFSDK